MIAWFRRRLVNTNENAPRLFLTLVLSLFLTSAHASEPEIADSMRDGECEVIVSFLNSLIAKHPTDKLQVIEDVTASVDMISIGEKTGELPEMLQNVAETYEEQVNTQVEAFTSLLEPIMIVGMGGAIGFIVLSVFMPLMDMSNINQR